MPVLAVLSALMPAAECQLPKRPSGLGTTPTIHNRIRFLHLGNMLNAPVAGQSTSADRFRTHLIGTLTRSRDGSPLTANAGIDLILGRLPARPGVCEMLRHAGVAHSART
jgi:hypothetical protein